MQHDGNVWIFPIGAVVWGGPLWPMGDVHLLRFGAGAPPSPFGCKFWVLESNVVDALTTFTHCVGHDGDRPWPFATA